MRDHDVGEAVARVLQRGSGPDRGVRERVTGLRLRIGVPEQPVHQAGIDGVRRALDSDLVRTRPRRQQDLPLPRRRPPMTCASKAPPCPLRSRAYYFQLLPRRQTRYGVFLRPDPLTCASVTRITGQLRAQFGLVSAGAFPPHATLAGSLPLAGPPEEELKFPRSPRSRPSPVPEPRARVAQRRPHLRRPRPRDGAPRRHRRRGRPPAARRFGRAGGGPVRARALARAPLARARTTSPRDPDCRTRSRNTSAGWPSRCRRVPGRGRRGLPARARDLERQLVTRDDVGARAQPAGSLRARHTGHAQARADPRASDQERERAVAEIRDHFTAGRLSEEELDERVAAAYAARTQRELAAPACRPARAPGHAGAGARGAGGAPAASAAALAAGDRRAVGRVPPVHGDLGGDRRRGLVLADLGRARRGDHAGAQRVSVCAGPAPELDRVERELEQRKRK